MKVGSKLLSLILLLTIMISVSVGCTKEEETPYTQNIVVELQALPFHMSALQYNNETEGSITLKLHQIFGTSLGSHLSQEEYIIVNHNGEDLTDEFMGETVPSSDEIPEIAMEIKEKGFLVVKKDRYRVTSIEKEIRALFNHERRIHPAAKLQEVLNDNRESYKNKDYEAINLYLIRNHMMVFDALED